MLVLDIVLWAVTGLLCVPLLVLTVETWLALLPLRGRSPLAVPVRPPCAVLMPAHDEENGIAKAIQALLPQMLPEDRLVVIADNCTDSTAEVARAQGATVIERVDPERRSKLYAVEFGVRYLEAAPPEAVVVVDADCIVPEGGLDQIVRATAGFNGPVQAAYSMEKPPDATIKDLLSAFAFQYKNIIRPLGLCHMHAPCLLTGTGLAMPWKIMRTAPIAHSRLNDDYNLSVQLAVEGHPTRFLPQVEVRSELPPSGRAAYGQRKRWEQGHLQCLFTQVPRLFYHAIRQGRGELVALALELSVPPLSLVFALWLLALAGLIAYGVVEDRPAPALVLGSVGGAALGSILAAWWKMGRSQLPFSALLAAPFYIAWKLPIYLTLLFKPQRAWLRTERAAAAARSPGSPEG